MRFCVRIQLVTRPERQSSVIPAHNFINVETRVDPESLFNDPIEDGTCDVVDIIVVEKERGLVFSRRKLEIPFDIIFVAAGLMKFFELSHSGFIKVEKVGIGFNERIGSDLFLHKDRFTDSRVVHKGPCLIQYNVMLEMHYHLPERS